MVHKSQNAEENIISFKIDDVEISFFFLTGMITFKKQSSRKMISMNDICWTT